MIAINLPEIEQYLKGLAKCYDKPIPLRMEAYGHENDFPIVDRLVGIMLMTLAKIAGTRRVFELGSGFGYSAYWFAQALPPDGRIICTDSDTANERKAEEFLGQSPAWECIEYRIGDAIDLLKADPGPYDIVYNDINKGDYPAAWEVAKTRVSPGGLYICDNTLWSGRVAESHVTDDVEAGWTEAIRDHNERVYADSDFDVTLIPLRDGVMVARKK